MFIKEDENIKYYAGDGKIIVYMKKQDRFFKLYWGEYHGKKSKEKEIILKN